MKAILYFVKSGRVTDEHVGIAETIKNATGKKVVFRNSTAAAESGESPEPNEGVAGDIPARYQMATLYDDEGTVLQASSEFVEADGEPSPVATNALGLKGVNPPNDREELKAYLEGEGVPFHPSAPTNKLILLYNEYLFA